MSKFCWTIAPDALAPVDASPDDLPTGIGTGAARHPLWRARPAGKRLRWFWAVVLLSLFLSGTTVDAAEAPKGPPIRIASIYALSGPAARSNFLSVEGVRFGVAEINQRGGVLGRPVELIERDNRSSPIGAKVAAEGAAEVGVHAIVGPEWSSHAIAAARVAQKFRIPMVTSIATHPKVTRIGDYVFRACFTDRFQGEVMARFARTRFPDAAGAAIFTDIISDHSMSLSDEFQRWFEALGGTVVARVSYRHSQERFGEVVAEGLSAHPDLLFLPGHDETGRILETARRQNFSATPLGGDGWGTATFLKNGGDRLKTGYYCTHWSPELDTPASRAFVKRFHPQGGILFSSHALAYDAVTLVADAIRRAGTLQKTAVRDALAATRDFHGVSGRITFNRHGDPIKPAVIMKIEDGRPRLLQRVVPPAQPPSGKE